MSDPIESAWEEFTESDDCISTGDAAWFAFRAGYFAAAPKPDDERDKRIAELEADLKIADDMGHDMDEKLHYAEAALREVGELPDRWDREMSHEMLEWLNGCDNPPSQANELRAILAKHHGHVTGTE